MSSFIPQSLIDYCNYYSFDYGFHLLLYIQGFHEMEIYNFNKVNIEPSGFLIYYPYQFFLRKNELQEPTLMQKEVLKFRKKLSIDLRFHRMNTIPAIIPVKEVVTVDEDED